MIMFKAIVIMFKAIVIMFKAIVILFKATVIMFKAKQGTIKRHTELSTIGRTNTNSAI